MADLPDLVATLGFPIAVTCYLLYERRAATKELSDAVNNHLVGAINALKVEITNLAAKLDGIR